jgi:hypothetical protein
VTRRIRPIGGFGVFLRYTGKVTAVVRFDDAGNPIREVDTGLLTFTFVAPSTGTSISYPTVANLVTDHFPDGDRGRHHRPG